MFISLEFKGGLQKYQVKCHALPSVSRAVCHVLGSGYVCTKSAGKNVDPYTGFRVLGDTHKLEMAFGDSFACLAGGDK